MRFRAMVNKMIEEHRKTLSVPPRKVSDEEIVQRLVFALVNEGAKILEEGIASKSGDIDMVYPDGLRLPHPPWWPHALRQRSRPVQRGASHEPLCPEPHGRRQRLGARTAPGRLAAEGKTFQ